ncbi:MAG: ribosome biogenesis/translation initiation ATPase RLI [Candidatus Micrarchaeota archaeon]|nr:ribosome biogenesis/translation initiation ATPase RLI [Candidatus Micrarchaeota archaeon]
MKFFGKTRIAIIEREKCLKERCGYLCAKVCPGVRMGEETVVVDKEGYPVISEQLCTGCGICPKKCPADCIIIINLAEERQFPLYQYGPNTFRLYGLPLPQQGVVGLIGKNGIGKSTAIKLMAGQIPPNFAEFGKKHTSEEILGRLPPELRNYFSTIHSRQLKVSLKPQNIGKIAEVFSGTVKELLEKNDERKAMQKAVELFALSKVLEREVPQLSGGELQRVAVAVAYCKEADIYYFDEPAAYLDVKQRLACARALKELSQSKKVVVVEHDLAIFDYLSDYVHVFFGQENAYGIVSGVKSARSGINEYLDGFLSDENTRFRDHPISFSVSSVSEAKGIKSKFSYPALEKSIGDFQLSCEAGSIMEGEIIGMLGENAMGKTLFMKMIAGVEKPDNCQLSLALRLSYKPQQLHKPEAVEVAELFSAPGLDAYVSEQARRRLGINSLMDKRADLLSGGELQRVAVALALSREADIYLFDEPSAFMDIEQRLEFADLLRKTIEGSKKSAFVIDHDLVLLDAISSRMVIFSGEPSAKGHASAPLGKREGMNSFLKSVGITLRRDKDSKRPRINKEGSVLDREQKEAGEFYYYEN